MYHISVDAGKAQTKAGIKLDGEVKLLTPFLSVVEEGISERLDNSVDIVVYEGLTYRVGNNLDAMGHQLDLDKRTQEAKVCVFTAIAKLMSQEGLKSLDEVKLYINVPLNHFKKADIRKAYTKWFKEEVSVNVNGENYNFEIVEVVPCYESIGYALNNAKALKGSETIIFDWGGLNFTYCVLDENLRPIINLSNSLMCGSHNVLNEANRKLNENGYGNYSNNDIKKIILNDGSKRASKEIKAIINDAVSKYIEQNIWSKISHLDLNQKIVATGGSSLLFQNYIKAEFSEHDDLEISATAVYDNVNGFLTLAK